jgi:hypothetical protein
MGSPDGVSWGIVLLGTVRLSERFRASGLASVPGSSRRPPTKLASVAPRAGAVSLGKERPAGWDGFCIHSVQTLWLVSRDHSQKLQSLALLCRLGDHASFSDFMGDSIFASTIRGGQSFNETCAAPKLNIVTSDDKALGLFHCFAVVGTNKRLEAHEMPVVADGIRPILRHRLTPKVAIRR